MIGSAASSHNAALQGAPAGAGERGPLWYHGRVFSAARTRNATLDLSRHDPARRSRRCRGGEPPAHAARQPDPPPRGRHVHLAADRPAGAAQGREHRPRGNEPRRRVRSADADHAARRAVAGIRPLGQVRPGTAAHQGPPRPLVLLRPDARRSDHGHRAPGTEELPPAAGQFLPDPDQVPRRDPPALRRDACARIHDEGRVFVPPRRRLARGGLPGDVPRVHGHLRAPAAEVPRRPRGHRQHRRQRVAGIPRAGRFGRGRHRVLRRRRLRRQPGNGRSAGACNAARRGDSGAAEGRDAESPHDRRPDEVPRRHAPTSA